MVRQVDFWKTLWLPVKSTIMKLVILSVSSQQAEMWIEIFAVSVKRLPEKQWSGTLCCFFRSGSSADDAGTPFNGQGKPGFVTVKVWVGKQKLAAG